MEAFESGVLDLPDFYCTGDDYRYRFEAKAKQRFLDLLRGQLTSGARYRGRWLKWNTVIEQKGGEVGPFQARKSSRADFAGSAPALKRRHARTEKQNSRIDSIGGKKPWD
jgi:hypothetical protein